MARRGRLRIYLGAAPGVGKTFAMLDEGRRRAGRGADVVIGLVETHGRERTAAEIGDLEIVPRHVLVYRGASFDEMDLDAVLARHPQIALVDELAHTNVPGSRNPKRWQDVEELLAAGIDVITTVNVQHLESLNDVALQITGVPQRETVPDAVVRAADQIELVDMSPEALRRRMAHGNVYAADKVDAALSHYFRVGNLAALRELALLWLADRVDEMVQRYRVDHGISRTWPTRERVVVAVTGGPESEALIRRAARIAGAGGGELMAVRVIPSDGLRDPGAGRSGQIRLLVEELGGTWHSVIGDDIAEALVEFATAENATQLVLGGSRRGRWSTFAAGSGVGQTVTRLSGDIDVHMVGHDEAAASARLPPLTGGLTARRRWLAVLTAVVLLPALAAALQSVDNGLNLTSEVLAFLAVVILIAVVGGLWPAVGAAVAASLMINWLFTPPEHEFTIAERNNAIALAVFVLVAIAVSTLVDIAARRTRSAVRARAEAESLTALAGSILRGEDALPALVGRVRETFSMGAVSLLRSDSDDQWHVVAASGPNPPAAPGEGDVEQGVPPDAVLVLRGRDLPASDMRVLSAFAAQASVLLDRDELAQEVRQVAPLAEADRMRTALLNAVSHDLRTPLATAKAAVTSLRSRDVAWSAEQHDDLLATADQSLDGLTRLVDNLLDMSRVDAGVVNASLRPVGWDEVVPAALSEIGPDGAAVRLRGLADTPPVLADPALLERVVVNLVANALRHSGSDDLTISASALGGEVELRVVDQGRGIPEDARERVFEPFQRAGDRDNTHGVGLGLALSRGLVESMRGSVRLEDTPGGGATMVVTLPAAGPAPVTEEDG